MIFFDLSEFEDLVSHLGTNKLMIESFSIGTNRYMYQFESEEF